MVHPRIWAAASTRVSGVEGGIAITEVNSGMNDWQQKRVCLVAYCWFELVNTFVNKKHGTLGHDKMYSLSEEVSPWVKLFV